MIVTSKKQSHRDNQRQVVHEFVVAQQNGFVSRIDVTIKKSIKPSVVYEPDLVTEPKSDSNQLDSLPEFDALHVVFSPAVDMQRINKVANYIMNRYDCKCTVYANNRLDAFFKGA